MADRIVPRATVRHDVEPFHAVVGPFQDMLAPYKAVLRLCEDMCSQLITAESGELLADLLSAVETVRLKATAIVGKMQEEEDIRISTAALEM